MTTRRRNLALLAFTLVVAGVAVFLFERQRVLSRPSVADASTEVLAAVPRDAFLVITVDLEALRASPLSQPLAGGAGGAGNLFGLGKLTELCGFDPLARMKQLAIAVPEDGDTGDFGVAALGAVSRDELVACAQHVIEARGGVPKVSSRGSFTLVEDGLGPSELAGARSSGEHAAPKIALRDGGPLLVGRGAWLQAMMDVAEGTAPGLRSNTAHAALREALLGAAGAAGESGPRRRVAPTILATAVLPRALRERLKHEMGAEGTGGNASNAAMEGVLDVETAGLAITTGAAGEDSYAAAELRCESDAACAEVKKLVEKTRLGFSKDFGVRLIGLGPLLDSLVVETRGTTLTATARAPTEQLASAIDRVLKMRAEPRATSPAPPRNGTAPAASALDAGLTDEVMRAKGRPAKTDVKTDAKTDAKTPPR